MPKGEKIAGRGIMALLLPVSILLYAFQAVSQPYDTTPYPVNDSLTTDTSRNPDTLYSNTLQNDSLVADSLGSSDTTKADTAKKGQAISSTVKYKAKDSISFDLKNRKVYLYKNAEIDYENINLKADRIEIDFPNNMIDANGIEDSTGQLIGKPKFTEGGKTYRSKEMRYNYETEKGRIKKVITDQGEGKLHGNIIKKMPDESINVRKGSYTTCNLDDPHFEIRYTKAKMLPDNKIVSGPAYLVIEDVPIPLFLPFGFFPNKQGQQSGILVPSYGESNDRGFFLEDGGYYWGISDKMDLEIRGDIYSRGSWAIEPKLRYKKRYAYSGNLNAGYTVNKVGEEGTEGYEVSKDFSVRWRHSQAPKARPNSNFNANVNIVTSSYNEFNPVNTQDYLSNTFQSSISYQTNFDQKVHLTANMSHSQNTKSKSVSMTVPQLSVSTDKFYPFRSDERVGETKWYEKISVGYTMDMKNTLSAPDSLITFDNKMFDKFKNGMKHSIPISSNLKVLNHLNLTNSINLTERWYTEALQKQFVDTTNADNDSTINGYVQETTDPGFQAVHEFSFSSSLSTRVYGMLNFKKGPVKAFRHVMNPSVSFSYQPDFSTEQWGYYDTYYDPSTKKQREYSLYEDGIYGYPSGRESGSLNFSLGNNFEMKVRTPNDTTQESKKIKLVDNLSLSTSYNLSADSLQWSPISVSGRTKIFKKLNVTYRSSYDMYALDSTGTRIDQFVWEESDGLLRRDNTSWNFGLDLSLSDKDLDEMFQSDEGTEAELQDVNENPEDYIRWDNKWSLNLSYTLNFTSDYQKSLDKYSRDVIQTLDFNGSLNITDKWKVRVRSGYDFKAKKLSYTSIDINRNLHCWQMSFNWVPFGNRQRWNFTLRAKSSLLQDLKIEKKKDFRDF